MASKRWRHALVLAGLLTLLGAPLAVHAESGVVWLAVSSKGETEKVELRIPLEWLANVDREGHSEIRFDDETVDCTELWLAHKNLPVGESREVRRGVTEDGEDYILRVVSDAPSSRPAIGKVHIMTWDRDGESVDIRFPLDLTGSLQQIGSFVGGLFGADTSSRTITRSHGLEKDELGDLKKLGDYGPFVFLESNKADGSKVRIAIE